MDDSPLPRMLARRGRKLRRRRGSGIGRRPGSGTGSSSVSMLRLRGPWRGLFVAAFLVGALPGGSRALEFLFHHVCRAARGTRLRHDFVPRRELALRIAAASVEQLSAPAPALENLALFAFRTCDSGLHRL